MGPRPIHDHAADSVGILSEARAALGRSARVTAWMNARQPNLENQVPAKMLSSAEGVKAVRRELQRIKNFRARAKEIVRELRKLDSERRSAALQALDTLESFAPQVARPLVEALQGREKAAQWLAERFGMGDARMAWESLADWDLEGLNRVLECISREQFD